ncbi:lipoprotein [Azotobacter vinelandii]|nr:lipoprotein [Azotobacter vinelandii]SFX31406.1 hypothetical protein SAMN04244547_01133 [Azotobacter vinelandii]
MKAKPIPYILLVQTLWTLGACQSQKVETPAIVAPVISPAQQAARTAVDEGSRQYEAGNFKETIELLSSTKEIAQADPETQAEAHKLLAFSYCLNGKKAYCHDEFSKLLAIDPAFQLSEAERHHPLWGPIFESARKLRDSK